MLVYCKVKPELLDALRDGELKGLSASLLRAHVRICGKCQEYLRQADEVSALLGELPELTPREGLGERVMAAAGAAEEPVLEGLTADLQAPLGLGGPDFTRSVLWRVQEAEDRRRKHALAVLAVAAAVALMVFSATLYACACRSEDLSHLGPLRPVVLKVLHLRSVVQSLDGAAWLRQRTLPATEGLWQRKARQAGLDLEDLGDEPGVTAHPIGAGPGARPQPTPSPPDGSAASAPLSGGTAIGLPRDSRQH